MKAPAGIHRALLQRGFGYGDGHYMGLIDRGPLSCEIRFDRGRCFDGAMLIRVMLFYPIASSSAGIVPLVVSCLRADERLWIQPDDDQVELFFTPEMLRRLAEDVCSQIFESIGLLSNAGVMLALVDFLMGAGPPPPSPFSYVQSTPYLVLKPTVHLLFSKVAYLNFMGDFENAMRVITESQLSGRLDDPIVAKFAEDARRKKIVRSVANDAYLKGLGVAI